MSAYDVFICHSSSDKNTIVLPLVERLEALGVVVWIDKEEIRGGARIRDRIDEGIQNSYAVLLFLTPSFFQSSWALQEVGASSAHLCSERIIPILAGVSSDTIREKLPWVFAVKYIEYDQGNIQKAASEVVSAINILKLRSRHETPDLLYRAAARRLHSFDMPASNRISILLTEYDQIASINMLSALRHASQVAMAIVDDLADRNAVAHASLHAQQKLDSLLHQPSGLNYNTYEHLKWLVAPNAEAALSVLATSEAQKKLVTMSLASVLDWYATHLGTVVPRSEECLVVAQPGTLQPQDFDDMYEIDTLVLREDLIAPAQVTYSWYEHNPYSHIGIRSQVTQRIVGYIAMLPITQELFDEIRGGSFKDTDLPVENILRYDIPDYYFLYISCVAVHPQYQNTKALGCLYRAAVQMMLDLAVEREVYITEVIADASTLQGEKLCKIIGLRKTLETSLNTSIYQGTLLPPALRLRSLIGSKLIRFYQGKYEELKLRI